MEAIYFGNAHWHGNSGAGTGPWAGADLEQGMYYGGGLKTQKNHESLSLTSDFVSLALKGRTDGFDLKGGDASKGEQTTMYSGPQGPRSHACGHVRWGAGAHWQGHHAAAMRRGWHCCQPDLGLREERQGYCERWEVPRHQQLWDQPGQ